MLSLSALGRASVCAAVFASACVATIGDAPADREPPLEAPAPPFEPGEERLRRLTIAQYRNAIRDIVGPEVIVPSTLEPDADVQGLLEVGAGLSTISARGVEQYETAAYAIAEQALGTPAVRDRVVPCEPVGIVDSTCARAFVTSFGLLAYRRPLDAVEADELVLIAGTAATTLGAFDRGVEYAMAAMLQSPNFLFRAELGAPDADEPGWRRLGGYELATRLSFFFWNTGPDLALLDAAATGALDTDQGVDAAIARLLEDDRARDGVRAFFTDMLRLRALDSLDKDPNIFVHMSAELGGSAREETLLGFEHLVFELDGDYRDVLTTRTAFLDRRLAAIYEVPAPAREGFGAATLPADGLRIGLLGQVSFLAPNAHATSSSATLRGKFVREVLLCGAIPPPPAMASTALSEPTGTAVTFRDRVAEHLTDPSCRSCHQLMDPLGLAFENFDGIGRFREVEFVSGIHARVATTTNISLSGTQAVDEVELSVDDTVLVTNQSAGSENGLYLVKADAWTRLPIQLRSGMVFEVSEGTANADTMWVLTTKDPDAMGAVLTFVVDPALQDGVEIDASGELGGVPFEDAKGLAQLLREHRDVPRCLVRTMYRYANGRVEVAGETEALHELTDDFRADGHRVRALMREVALHRSFRLSVAPAGLEVP